MTPVAGNSVVSFADVGAIAFENLDEPGFVENEEARNAGPGVIALRRRHDVAQLCKQRRVIAFPRAFAVINELMNHSGPPSKTPMRHPARLPRNPLRHL